MGLALTALRLHECPSFAKKNHFWAVAVCRCSGVAQLGPGISTGEMPGVGREQRQSGAGDAHPAPDASRCLCPGELDAFPGEYRRCCCRWNGQEGPAGSVPGGRAVPVPKLPPGEPPQQGPGTPWLVAERVPAWWDGDLGAVRTQPALVPLLAPGLTEGLPATWASSPGSHAGRSVPSLASCPLVSIHEGT